LLFLREVKSLKEQKEYNVAVYCRLSKDDDIRGGDSSSIKSQKGIAEQFIKNNGWKVYDCYIDDGYSGVDFKRPAFERMIGDIEAGKVNLVVTKDLSRLGRNYLLTGQYTEIYFPSKGVRYIALNDNVDTLNSENNIAPFLNILNEMYAKDIAKKVRTAVLAKKLRGEYASSYAPYGYQKDPQDKHKLIVEETGATVVRRIFEMTKADMGSRKICKALNEEGVLTPINHRNKLLYGIEPKPAIWQTGTVGCILRNQIYAGDMVQGTYENSKFSHKTPRRRPKEEWIIVPDTHEPIVDRETWEYVQKAVSARKHPVKDKTIQLFAGFLKCGGCGLTLGYQKRYGIEYYTCSTYRRNGSKYCSAHYVRRDVLEQIVLGEIRKYAKLAKDKTDEMTKRLQALAGEKDVKQIKALAAEAERLKTRDTELDGIMKQLYEDRVAGKLSDERLDKFLTDYEKEQSETRARIGDAEKTMQEIEANRMDAASWTKLIRGYTRVRKLDRTILSELIDKIVIGESIGANREKQVSITIYYRFIGAVG
jgi:DNA invertase Pin-like site-specific DNA recombinase